MDGLEVKRGGLVCPPPSFQAAIAFQSSRSTISSALPVRLSGPPNPDCIVTKLSLAVASLWPSALPSARPSRRPSEARRRCLPRRLACAARAEPLYGLTAVARRSRASSPRHAQRTLGPSDSRGMCGMRSTKGEGVI